MPKLNIKVTTINESFNETFQTTAIIQDETLKYKEENKTTAIFDYKNNRLFRENNELRMEYSFNKTKKEKGIIYIKDLNKEINVDIKTKKIERKNIDIEIEYEIEENKFLYKIEEIK